MDLINENTCHNCGYYRQHYIWSKQFRSINSGHCVHPPRVRQRRPEMNACIKWIPQSENYKANYIPPGGAASDWVFIYLMR